MRQLLSVYKSLLLSFSKLCQFMVDKQLFVVNFLAKVENKMNVLKLFECSMFVVLQI